MKVQPLSDLSETVLILKPSVLSHCRTCTCQLKSPACPLGVSSSAPWISLLTSSEPITALPRFVHVFVVQAWEQKVSRDGCDLA